MPRQSRSLEEYEQALFEKWGQKYKLSNCHPISQYNNLIDVYCPIHKTTQSTRLGYMLRNYSEVYSPTHPCKACMKENKQEQRLIEYNQLYGDKYRFTINNTKLNVECKACGNITQHEYSKEFNRQCFRCKVLLNKRINRDKKLRQRNSYKNSYSTIEYYNRYKQDAQKRNKMFSLTLSDFTQIVTKPCVYCGVKRNQTSYRHNLMGIDRIDSSVGYHVDNCVPCCKQCNYLKGEQTVEEFSNRVKAIWEKYYDI